MIQWITRDWGSKLISLVLAIGLWTYAVGEESIEVTRTIPLEISIKNPQMSILKKSSNFLEVTLTAPRNLLSAMTSQDITALHVIESDVTKAGEYSFRVEGREIKLPKPQMSISKIQPEVVWVTLDELIVEKLPVKPQFVGEPAFGYKVIQKQIQMDPDSVLVQGPKGKLEKLDSILTEPIDLVGRIRSFRRTLSVALPENIKATSESLIDTFIPIQEESQEKKFDNVSFRVLNSSENQNSFEITPLQVSFVLVGAKRQVEKLDTKNILAYADLSNLTPGEHEVPIVLTLPENVTLKDKIPVVHVSVKKK